MALKDFGCISPTQSKDAFGNHSLLFLCYQKFFWLSLSLPVRSPPFALWGDIIQLVASRFKGSDKARESVKMETSAVFFFFFFPDGQLTLTSINSFFGLIRGRPMISGLENSQGFTFRWPHLKNRTLINYARANLPTNWANRLDNICSFC